MKYVNANDVLPEELLSMIQKYYQGGYLYIPKGNYCEVKQQTDYKIELEKRNQHIYLKHLEGRTNGQLGNIYHLSEASIRRIISKEKVGYQKMKEIIEQILPLWGMENKQLLQIYPSAWEINHSYVIKVYDDKKQLERNIKISEILLDCTIPVAKTVLTKTGEKYIEYKNIYFLMSKKLRGSNISDIKDKTIAWEMGCSIAQLHMAFIKCEKEIDFWDNSLLKEMKGWIREYLTNNEWKILNEEEYSKTVELLESVYDYLPKQLIHRDVHLGNFLFFEGNFSGYIDFDLSQRNIRIFDICYFLTGLLAEETDDAFTKIEWIENAKSVIAGYESIINLSEKEKNAIPCVMECIEILFVAYFISINDTKHANDAYNVFRFIQNCESDIKNAI
ncbi:MAG: phosphotransferase [Lachnospiraceae bacterium]|nr:phosphotransferase [Lachnospiraceae bacterium]